MRRPSLRASMAATTSATLSRTAPRTLAIEKAEAAGIAVVGANNTWYTGMLSYYAEMAAARGLVSIIASNASPWVAPHGATEGRLGTNPICFGFPSADEPIIFDAGTSAIIHAEVTLARRLGNELPANTAFDSRGLAYLRSHSSAGRRVRDLGWPQGVWPWDRCTASRHTRGLTTDSA